MISTHDDPGSYTLLDELVSLMQIHEREAQLADLAAAYDALQQQHSQDVQALQGALHKARSHARQLEQRWAVETDVLLCQPGKCLAIALGKAAGHSLSHHVLLCQGSDPKQLSRRWLVLIADRGEGLDKHLPGADSCCFWYDQGWL